ncbi:MAG TPA: branched-chain amino acid ABC transporter permease [Candidatus Dormibacteraeota bacterium]
MTTFIANTIIGLSLGGIFALAALGIVLVYRVTGVLNFANGAMGMFSTFVAWDVFFHRTHQNFWLSLIAGLLFSVVLGLALQWAVFYWLAGRTQLIKAVVTIGVLLVLQAGASLIWGNTQYHVPIAIPNGDAVFSVAGAPVSFNHVLIIVVAIALAAGLAVFLRLTKVGIAMRAVSEDVDTSRIWGVPVGLVGSISWVMGSAVAALAGILITPFINFDTISMTLLVLDALAAALIGGLVSLPLTVVGGFALGLFETYPHALIPGLSLGFSKVVAIVVILAVLLLRRQSALVGRQA